MLLLSYFFVYACLVAGLYNAEALSRSTIAAEDYVSTLIDREPTAGFSTFSTPESSNLVRLYICLD
jgi:hypothetical protein